MLSEKIDLTENRDFGDNTVLDFAELALDKRLFEDDTQFFRRNESIFGQKYHKNEFYKSIKTYNDANCNNICECCGKVTPPWNLDGFLCKECNNIYYERNIDYIGGEYIGNDTLNKCHWHKYDYATEKDILQSR